MNTEQSIALPNTEEDELYEKIKLIKEVYDQLDSLIKSGYEGKITSKKARPLMDAYKKAKEKL
jgi:hypothetical protein